MTITLIMMIIYVISIPLTGIGIIMSVMNIYFPLSRDSIVNQFSYRTTSVMLSEAAQSGDRPVDGTRRVSTPR